MKQAGRRGRFITIEGGEGVGKSVLRDGLVAALEQDGVRLLVTREPGGTETADRIRRIFADPPKDEPMAMETEAMLVNAARSQHVRSKILPALEEGSWVLSDRFADSTRVYQGRLGGLPDEAVEALISMATDGLEPDLTFVLDCPVEVSLSRVTKRPAAGAGTPSGDEVVRYDDAPARFHTGVREAFLDLAKRHPERIFVLDATEGPEDVREKALSVIRERLYE